MRSLKLSAILLHCMLLAGWPSLAACSSSAHQSPGTPATDGKPASAAASSQKDYAKVPPSVDAGQRIAVLLPLHGKFSSAGQAIQQGMLAAWYRRQSEGRPVPEILFLDSATGDFKSLHAGAIGSGAQLLIGPLEKQNLALLLKEKEPPVPTIALNYLDEPNPHDTLFFLGLSGDDEAEQVAARMLADGHRRPVLLLAPDDWAQRIGKHFTERFTAGGGQPPVVGTISPGAEPVDTVRKLLDVTSAQARHARLEQVLGTDLSFAPSARRDIDSLFLVAGTALAAQFVPAIRYHGAEGLPVYATSHINNQAASSGVADDLSGVHFIEIPGLASRKDLLQDDLPRAGRDDTDIAQARLQALGSDALIVADGLEQLRDGKSLDGLTGRLTLDARQAVRRELDWMHYQGGKAVPEDAPPP